MDIGICDDEKVFLKEIKASLIKICKMHQWTGKVCAFSSGEQMMRYYVDNKLDIIFLDIDIPEMDGFTIAEMIPERDTLLVFCTSHNELVYRSFSYQPFWFLCKENYLEHLEEVLVAASKKLALKNRTYEFNINGEIFRVNIDEIKYFDVSKHRVYVHLSDNKQLDYRENLSKVEEVFQKWGFVRINSGCLINMLWIRHIYQNDLEFKDGQILSISRSRRNEVKERFHEYMRLKR